jgi:hypothetical protein
LDRAKEVGRVTDGLRLKGSKEFARLNVEGASHVDSPSQRMEDLYQEHDPSYVARKTPANMALRTRLGYVGESNDSRLPDRNGIYWGNGVVNGPIDQLRVIEADIREKHPNWKFSYDLHRPALSESDLEGLKEGDKVLIEGHGSWNGVPFIKQGIVAKAEHGGWNYAQYGGQNRLIIKLKGKRKASLIAAPDEKASDIRAIARLEEYLPESQVSAMERAYDEAEEAEGWPIRSTDRNVVLGPVRERLEE